MVIDDLRELARLHREIADKDEAVADTLFSIYSGETAPEPEAKPEPSPAPKSKAKPKAEPAPEPVGDTPKTLDELMSRVSEKVEAGIAKAVIKALLEKYGANKVSNLPFAQYTAFYAELKELK
jgi:hypothetical protein